MSKLYALLLFILTTTMTTRSQTRVWNGGNGSWNDATQWTPIGVPSSSDIVEFTGVSGTVSNVPTLTFKGMVISGGNIILNAKDGDTKTLTTGQAGSENAIVIGAGAVLTIGNNLDLALAANTKAIVNGSLVVTAGRHYYTNAGETSKTIIKGALVNEGGSIISLAAMLEFHSGAVYQHTADKGTIPPATWHERSTCSIEGVVTQVPEGLNQVFGNLKWNFASQAAGQQLGIMLPADIKGDLIIDGATSSSSFLFPATTNIDGDFLLNGGTVAGKEASSTIELGGDLIMQAGSLKANTSASTGAMNIRFNGTVKQLFHKTGGTFKGIKFTIANNAIVDLGESIIDGEADFTVEAGGTLLTAHPEGIASTGASGAIQVSGKRDFSSEADYGFTGTQPQVTGTGLPATVRRLIIENASGVLAGAGVTLSSAVSVSKELVLSKGYLQTATGKILTVLEEGIATAKENSFISGPMQKKGNADFTFPTGWSGQGGGQVPIGIVAMENAATIQAEYKRAGAITKGTTINAPLHHISYCEYWELFPLTGSTTGNIAMYRNSYSNCNPVSYVNDFTSLRVARSNGSAWSEIGNTYDSLVDGNGYLISDKTTITSNSSEKYFALGHITTARDPLPVLFDNVMAYEKNESVHIEWSNLTERDVAIYYVERSTNGMDYTIIGQHLPKSNRDDDASYLHIDEAYPHGEVFYRIKVIAKNTKIILSKVMRIESMKQQSKKLGFYPNPVTNKQFALALSGMPEGKYSFRITTLTGQEIYQNVLVNQGSFTTQTFGLPSSTKPGVYSLIITGSNYQENKMFIVQ